MSVRCCVEGCANTNERYPSKGTYYNGRFFRFPEHPDKRKLWNDIIGSNSILIKFICFEHFTDDDWIYRDIVMNVPISKRKLKPDAKPSRKLPTIIIETNVKKVAKVKDQMDEATRKRLVAEAMAEYEKLNSDSQELPYGRALARKMRCPSIDEETRKRLVAEALAAYEKDAKKPTNKNHRTTNATMPVCKEVNEDTYAQMRICKEDYSLVEYPVPYVEINDNDSTDAESTAELLLSEDEEPEVTVEEMEIPVKVCNFASSQQRKCGEVVLEINDKTFSMNCSLCPGVFLNFMSFSNHILTYHTSLLEQNNSSNPLDGHAGNTVELREKQKDLTMSASKQTGLILPETILIDTLENVEELQKNNISDSESEECFLTSVEILPNDNESNEISIHNKPLVLQVIKLLKQKQFHLIWDQTHSEYGWHRKRKETITQLITSLLKSFPNLTFTYDNIRSVLIELRRSYITELRERQKANQKDEPYMCKLWCFNELKFLEANIKICKRLNTQTRTENYQKISKQHPLAPLLKSNSMLTEQETIDIIEEYEKRPKLWSISHPRYRGKFKDYEGLYMFQLAIQEKNPKICFNEQTTLELVVKHMLNWYTAEETLRQESMELNQDYQSNFPRIFEAMAFLSGNVPPFKCKLCENEFNIEYKYMRHIRDTKSMCGTRKIDVIYECQYCHRRFATQRRLNIHIRKHTDERPYPCPKCGKTFRDSCSVARHKLIHNSKTFKCDKCEKSFYSASILRSHQKMHLEIREKKICHICGKGFLYATNLSRHYRLHIEQPRFACDCCGRKYTTFLGMSNHQKRCSTGVDSKKRKKKNKEKVTKNPKKSRAKSKTDKTEQNCSKASFSLETQTLVDSAGKESGQLDVVEEELIYIYEDI